MSWRSACCRPAASATSPADIVIREGRGGRVWDVSGNEYVDFLLGSGPMFIGHCHPDVMAAVQAQIPRGTTFFANNEHGIRLAAAIVDAVPCAEKVRFVCSGTEADAYAMRVARAFRGRDKILKFEGGYHGMSDYSLMSLAPKRPGNFPQAVPDSPGIPRSVRDEMIIAPFNDAAMAVSLIHEHHDELGGVIVEPFQRLLPPKPGFLQALRDARTEHGIPLIFDEVVTGFRFAYGGAQEFYGVTPDLCTLGKIIGGGFPLAAIAGREDIMSQFDRGKVGDERFLTQIGTLSGNPVAAVGGPGDAGGPAATRRLREGVRDRARTDGGHDAMLEKAGLPAQVIGVPPLFDVVYAAGDVSDYPRLAARRHGDGRRFNRRFREGGILKGESKFYVSLAHDAADVRHTLDAVTSAVKAELAETRVPAQ